MTIEPVTELGSGGALRVPRARVVPLSAPPASYTAAVERYLTGAGIAKSSARIYRISLTTWGDPRRRTRADRTPPAGARSRPSSPSPRSTTRHYRRSWPSWRRRGRTRWTPTPLTGRCPSHARRPAGGSARAGSKALPRSASSGGRHRRTAPRLSLRTRSPPCGASTSRCGRRRGGSCSTSPPHGPTRCCASTWKTSTRRTKRGKITAKGGATEWIHWQSGTAQLLPPLTARRTRGPLFLTDRKAPAGTPTLDVCPETGRARLSYRRAEEIFEENTRLLANPLASPDDIEDLDGWTLHRLRHSVLTHDAGRHLHPDAAGPLPPRLRPIPGAVCPPRRRLGRPARRRTRPRCTPQHVSGSGLQDHLVAPLARIPVTPQVRLVDTDFMRSHPRVEVHYGDPERPDRARVIASGTTLMS